MDWHVYRMKFTQFEQGIQLIARVCMLAYFSNYSWHVAHGILQSSEVACISTTNDRLFLVGGGGRS